jgi:hypothetical protein
MTELQDLATLIRAATPLIAIETAEENRVIKTFRHLIAQVLRPLYRCSRWFSVLIRIAFLRVFVSSR